MAPAPHIELIDLELAYGEFVVMRNINAQVQRGEVFVIMGGSGCGKSTLLWNMIGLRQPPVGDIRYDGHSLLTASVEEREAMERKFGVLFQGGALWSSMTLAENIALPLEEHTRLPADEIRRLVHLKLSLVGLKGFEDFYPSEVSGGMMKRAGLARAMALDPEILFFDEPSAGLDPVTSRRLDELILNLRDNLGTTIVMVSHELDSIFAVADQAIFLDSASRTVTASGNPRKLLQTSTDPAVRAFLTRGGQKQPEMSK
jgi:phospholipid/cholesterol/gamma-HCH transport system ATP-binding protein